MTQAASSIPIPSLIEAQELHSRLGDPALRIYDPTVSMQWLADGSHTNDSGQPGFDIGHIPGAMYLDMKADFSKLHAPHDFTVPDPGSFAAAAGAVGIGDGVEVVVYSHDHMMWATRFWWMLRYFGFDNVKVLNGGLTAWKEAGFPLSQERSSYPRGNFTVRHRPELLATLDDVKRILSGGEFCLVNALPTAVFKGEVNPYGRPGRIPDSISAPYVEVVDTDSWLFRPVDEIESALRKSGALDHERIVAYCGGGMSATIDVFALGLIGRQDVRLYDGSLGEWVADESLPLEVG